MVGYSDVFERILQIQLKMQYPSRSAPPMVPKRRQQQPNYRHLHGDPTHTPDKVYIVHRICNMEVS